MPEFNQLAALKLQNELNDDEGFLIEDPYDLYYMLKKPISLGSLLITKNECHLFVDGRYFSAFSKFKHLSTHPSEKEGFLNFLKHQKIKTIYFDSGKTSYEKGMHFKKYPLHFEPKKDLLKSSRIIKTPEEISLIRKSSHLLASIYQDFLKLPKIGLSEKQIAKQFQILSFEKGAEGFSFEPIIAIGENSAYPHHRPGDRVLKEGDIMLVDVGVTKNNYQSDMTRMVFFGAVNDKLLKYHDYVLEAHQAALNLCRPGIKVGQLDEAARNVFKRYHVESLFTHSLGHGLGLETHESPRLKFDGADKDIVLEKGMIITIEPGLYEEGLGGIRHEDLIVITDEGFENFYPSYF